MRTKVEVLFCQQPGVKEVDRSATESCWVWHTVDVGYRSFGMNEKKPPPFLLADVVEIVAERSHVDHQTRYAYARFAEDPASERFFKVEGVVASQLKKKPAAPTGKGFSQ